MSTFDVVLLIEVGVIALYYVVILLLRRDRRP
jgi:hypothetical protein